MKIKVAAIKTTFYCKVFFLEINTFLRLKSFVFFFLVYWPDRCLYSGLESPLTAEMYLTFKSKRSSSYKANLTIFFVCSNAPIAKNKYAELAYCLSRVPIVTFLIFLFSVLNIICEPAANIVNFIFLYEKRSHNFD